MSSPVIDQTIELILSPDKSGVYLTKPDIGRIAIIAGFSIILQERKRMIDELFSSVKSKEELELIYNSLISFVDAKIIDYNSIFNFFPSSKTALEKGYMNSTNAIEKLKEFKEEAMLFEFTVPCL